MYKVCLAAMMTLLAAAGAAAAPLTVVSWGGAYEAAQRRAIFDPFVEETGIELEILSYQGGTEPLRQRAEREGWDVIDMTQDTAIAACQAGLLTPVDYRKELASQSAVAVDFLPGAFGRCSVAQNIFATVIAYYEPAFPGVKPENVADFFDLEKFPGKRALERSPDTALEWALLAEGVPVSQIYDLLSTERGLQLAFRKLDEIRDFIIWWESASEAPDMLANGRAIMASGYNGRFFAAANDDGAPLSIIWDGQLTGYEAWVIPESTDDRAKALEFIRFATRPDRLARLAEHIPYAPARRSALSPELGLHRQSGVPMRFHLPNAPQRHERVLSRDSHWYASTRKLRRDRFKDWLADAASNKATGEN